MGHWAKKGLLHIILICLSVVLTWPLSSLAQVQPLNGEPCARSEDLPSIFRHRRVSLVFVTGLKGDLNLDSFSGLKEALGDDFLKTVNLKIIRPDSNTPVATNAQKLYQEINKMVTEEKTYTFVVSHSKGAAEMTAAIVNHPELAANRYFIGAVMLNAALGTKAVDVVGKVCSSETFKNHADCKVMNSITKGIQSLSVREVEKTIHEQFQKLQAEDVKNIYSKVIYYTSKWVPNPLENAQANIFRDISYYLYQAYNSHQTDGTVEIERQYIPNLGQMKGPLPAPHSFPNKSWFGRLTPSGIANIVVAEEISKIVNQVDPLKEFEDPATDSLSPTTCFELTRPVALYQSNVKRYANTNDPDETSGNREIRVQLIRKSTLPARSDSIRSGTR